MNANSQLPSELRDAREAFRQQRYTGPAPDFSAAPRSRGPLRAVAAIALIATAVGLLLSSDGDQQPPPVEWAQTARSQPTLQLSLSLPVPDRLAMERPVLPSRPRMPSAPTRPGGFGDVGADSDA